MKIDIIAESVEENMSLLKKLTSIVLKYFPENIEKESEFWIYGYNLVSDLKPLLSEYQSKKQKEIIIRVASCEIFVSNYVDNSFKSYGSYSHVKNTIYINLAGIVSNALTWKKQTVVKSIKVKSTILHELRHLAQYTYYPDFYEKDMKVDFSNAKSSDDIKNIKSAAYKKRKIEIDAAWHHILDETNPINYSTPKDYSDRVMNVLSNYKDLTQDQVKHYKAKTVRYYYLVNREDKLEFINGYIDSTISSNNYTNLKDLIVDVISGYFGDDFDYDNASPKEQQEYREVRNAIINKFKSTSQLR